MTEYKKDFIRRLLRHPMWQGRSTNWLAKRARVSWMFADKVRESERAMEHGKRKTKNGKHYPGRIGSRASFDLVVA
jgi:hypothetical protein